VPGVALRPFGVLPGIRPGIFPRAFPGGRFRALGVLIALGLGGAGAAPAAVHAQDVRCPDGGWIGIGPAPAECRTAEGDWRQGASGQIAVLAVNVIGGGLTGGIGQWRRDGSFVDGFRRGALGGAGTWLGKRVVVSDFPGAGLGGRTLAAVGASVTRSAAHGDPSFERLVLPLGPVRFHWNVAGGELHTSLDLFAVGGLVWAYGAGLGSSLDLGRTLSSGSPVLLARDWEREWGWHARNVGGTVILRGDRPGDPLHHEFLNRAFAHERVHTLQHDQAYILWSMPLEQRMFEGLGVPARVVRSLDLSIHGLVVTGLDQVLDHDVRPWEIEADILARTLGRH
jgi:hypothetical protein